MRWDIFCKVIDNHGDLGVCWRLSRELAARGDTVRLWVDDASALTWMAPGGRAGVQVLPWGPDSPAPEPGDAVIEAFGCDPHPAFLAALAQAARTRGRQPAWINLEYLSGEDWVPRLHGLPSPVMSGPAKGWTKQFIYPGFEAETGGLLREPDLMARQARFDPQPWLRQLGIAPRPEALRVSLFCYEPAALVPWLAQQGQAAQPLDLLVTPGRAQQAVAAAQSALGWSRWPDHLRCHALPWLSQTDFDHLLWACDMNFVRGEDSLVRALWAGKPWVWQIYPQDDLAHHAKLQALCDKLQMPADLQAFQRRWNQVTTSPLAPLTRAALDAWGVWSRQIQQLLMRQTDLTTQLIEFTRQKR